MMKSNNELHELKVRVKKETGYNLSQIDIDAYNDKFIDYSIYKNSKNDILLGRKPLFVGRIGWAIN